MTTRLQRFGDELGLIIDPTDLEKFGVDEETEFVVSSTEEGIFLRPIRFASLRQVEALTPKIMEAHSETLQRLSL